MTIGAAGLETVAVDAEVFEALRQMKLWSSDEPEPAEPPTIEDVLDTLESRLTRKLTGGNPHPVWRSLSERLEALRRSKVDSAAASVEILKQILEIG